ncbi:MAG TPA: hypothetical protein VMT99_00080 [Candidatus Paceibacterota bacterium]|nr:hypothetical protein [Candidatus Paceibacterota bacterium]
MKRIQTMNRSIKLFALALVLVFGAVGFMTFAHAQTSTGATGTDLGTGTASGTTGVGVGTTGTGTGTTGTSTTVPGVPNTGAGGAAPLNWVLLAGSSAVIGVGVLYLLKERGVRA